MKKLFSIILIFGLSFSNFAYGEITIRCKIEHNSRDKVKWYHLIKEKIYYNFDDERLKRISSNTVDWNEIDWSRSYKKTIRVDGEYAYVTHELKGIYVSKLRFPTITTYELFMWEDYDGGYFFTNTYVLNYDAYEDWVKLNDPSFENFISWKENWDSKNDWQNKVKNTLYANGECKEF
jgi:hypothetical protein